MHGTNIIITEFSTPHMDQPLQISHAARLIIKNPDNSFVKICPGIKFYVSKEDMSVTKQMYGNPH
jgi:hypothetical protein